eukprot:TRINITY_DN42876_c0_g1_i1.p1 TRINITY_DN42876_c0_g1~~TRINITY_DN42876_c0_g1_i1.p1  ORF type:complete len:369 (+),score=51.76 TRINITY_DN42876_c0_g1_i1:71-1108(+)
MAGISVGSGGGGVAGVTAARVLQSHGFRVHLYERTNTLGGRLGTVNVGGLKIGSGTSYFKAKHPLFQSQVRKWEADGIVGEWHAGTPHVIDKPGNFSPKPAAKPAGDRWFVGYQSMSSIVELSNEERKMITLVEEEISSMRWCRGIWTLNDVYEHSAMICAVPVARLMKLLPLADLHALLPHQKLAVDFEKARYSGMFVFPESLSLPFTFAFPLSSPISLILNDSSRKSSANAFEAAREAWVVQTDTAWAAKQLQSERSKHDVAVELLEEFRRVLAMDLAAPLSIDSVPWSYGDVHYDLPNTCAFDHQRGLALAGDWCHNGRVEGAWLSGRSAAELLLRTLRSNA